ncbi:hypothetical protein ACU8V7_26265 [Zobellia nedashkovskayae]
MKIIKRILLILFVILAVAVYFNFPKLNFISGYASKNMASTVFLTNRSAESVVLNDNDVPLINLADVETDGKSATASVFGLMERKAICIEGLGCTLVNKDYDPNIKIPVPQRIKNENNLAFPYGDKEAKDTVFANVDYGQLQKAMDQAFTNNEVQKTRTVLVAHKNHIIGEKYLDGFTKDTPILGWSMTKSVLATLYGILEYEEKLDLNEPVLLEGWEKDDRKKNNA